jgi:hypothetical protein
MTDLNQNPEIATEGQAQAPPDMTGTTAGAQVVDGGQVASQDGATVGQAATSTPPVDTFYDPAALPDELKTIYKQMQSAYTKKTQAIAQDRQLLDAAKQFVANPIQHMQRIAAEHGYVLTPAQAQAALNVQAQQQPEAWEPKSWDEVLSRAEERTREKVMAEVMQKMAPFLQNVQQIQAKTIEAKLDAIDTNWRMYEDDMRQTLQQHPSLVSDVEKLYRLSVPEEVYSSRAVQTALAKLQSKATQATVGSRSSTSRTIPAPKVPKSFAEAVEIAKQQLAQQGG